MNSSVIKNLDFRLISENHTILDIDFQTGHTYRYYGVPVKVFNELANAPSRGRYFMDNIRDRYNYEKIA